MQSRGSEGAQGREHLPLGVKLAYAAPSFAGASIGIAIGVFLPRFYSDVVLAPLGVIAVAIAAARAFDALTDPIMGWVSDRTRTRWGRRKPFLALGGPFAALTFYLLFAPPSSLTPNGAAVWFAVFFTLFFLFTTVVQVPYGALGAELTSNYSERSSLFGYRAMFVAGGLIAGGVVPILLEAQAGIADERLRYRIMAGLYALLLGVFGTMLLVRVSERFKSLRHPANPLVPGVRRALRNRPFRILLLAGIVHAVPAAIPAILMPYYVTYVLQPDGGNKWTGIFLCVYLVTGLLFVPLWMFVARRFGKLATLVIASAIGIVASVFFFFAGPGRLFYAAGVYVATGAISMVNPFLIPAMLADVIDYDQLRTGKRREAQYAGFLSLVPKFVAIPGSSIPLAILAAAGYVPNQAQAPEVLFWIRFMYSVFPAAFYVVALLIVARYPISEVMHGRILGGIERHRRGESAVDPLSGRTLTPRGSGRVSEADGWFLDHFTTRELRRFLVSGAPAVLRSTGIAVAGSVLLCVISTVSAVVRLTSTTSVPGPVAVLSVVFAGAAFTVFLYQSVRFRAARRLVQFPLSVELVHAHLRDEVGLPRHGTA